MRAVIFGTVIEIYSDGNGWVEVKSETAIYNLLELTNGTMAVVVDMNVEAGQTSDLGIIELEQGNQNEK